MVGHGNPTEQFIQALHEMERTRNIEAIVPLFTDEAELRKPAMLDVARGRDGARRFWQEYWEAFHEIHSEFTHVLQGEGHAVLEWVAEGVRTDGSPIRYEGVTLLEFQGSQVRRFRTYYDTAAFVPAGARGHTQSPRPQPSELSH